MSLDVFDLKVVDVLKVRGAPATLDELVRDTGFACSTVIIHLERLMSEGLVSREKKPREGRGRPKFHYRLVNEASKPSVQPSIVLLEFSKLRKICKYEKGGYCKLAKNTCTDQNCRLIIKPK
jgi:predicted ArsR family transcriptional regulator